MKLLPTGIKLTDASTKWGLVTVANPDGTLNRQYTIKGKEADAVVQGNNVVPPGCTDEEWFAGLVMVACRPCNPGQAYLNPEGDLVINYGVDEADGKVSVKLMQCFAGEFAEADGALEITDTVAKLVDVPFKAVKV
jgi:hypothetical protein